MTYQGSSYNTLSENQKSVIPHALECITVEKTSKRTGLPESLLRDWFRQPAFKREIENYRRDLARAIMFKLEKGAHKAIDRIMQLIDDDNKSISLKAADSFLSHMSSYKGLYGMHETIDIIEENIEKAKMVQNVP